MPAFITVGATTNHGGTVITGSPTMTHNGKPVARVGDKVACKKCKKVVTIVSGDSAHIVDGRTIARAGDKTSCGSTLIATQQSFLQSGFEVGQIAGMVETVREAVEEDNGEEELFDDKFQLIDKLTQKPLANVTYIISYDGHSITGVTDEQGYTETIEESYPAEVNIKIIAEEV